VIRSDGGDFSSEIAATMQGWPLPRPPR
jgi:hypothetical protein